MITIAALNGITGVRHAFFTREGGVSQGIYASLNCGFGSGDAAERVAANRIRALDMLDMPADTLVTVHQAHTAEVVIVEGRWRGAPPTADAMVTNVPGLALGILTADCAPVLFTDQRAGVVGAAHAGWRGALGGVLEATLAAMRGLGARNHDIVAAIGPHIAYRSYEVGEDFPAPFLAKGPDQDFFTQARRPGHLLFDLGGYVARRIARTGVTAVYRSPFDTCIEESRFFSFRRATQRGEPDYGRQLSAIVLER